MLDAANVYCRVADLSLCSSGVQVAGVAWAVVVGSSSAIPIRTRSLST